MKKLRFVWIDDQVKKVEAYRRTIETGVAHLKLASAIELIEVGSELLDTLNTWTAANEGSPPDLFIIDHVFNAALPFGINGSSVAHLLRNTFPAAPMVCVTSKYDDPNSFDQEDLSEYTALFLYTQLEHHVEDIFVIARDFKKLLLPGADVREHLASLLKPPRGDRDDLIRLLPEEFQNPSHATTEHRLARWIYAVLLRRPGFLYDRLHVATLLGLTESGFTKVESTFSKALYKGVFATQGRPRWWVREVHRILFSQAAERASSVPQIAGRALPGIDANDHSVCYVSKKSDPPPTAVVLADATRAAVLRVVRIEYAKQHPNDPGTAPGFETRQVLARKRA